MDPLLLLGLIIGAIAGALIALGTAWAYAHWKQWRISTATKREDEIPVKDALVRNPIDGKMDRVVGTEVRDGQLIIETESTT